jgi:tRNA A-37 threonylcarbamoyl transferase component Bud32
MRVRQQFANYEIQGVLGEGGQGLVYRAIDKKLKRPVAIKLMKREYSADPLFVKRFQSEAKVTAGLNHPNIVKVFSFGEDRGLLYLAMEMVDHGSLDSLMAEQKKVPEDRALEVGIQIAKGLKAGLEKGLIHRDIKPGNILFADEHTAKIVDFGLAVLVEKQHEEEGDVWATPYYVSPEKLDGQSEDFHSDMYSLAATLFHAIAGRPPFIAETNSMSELKKIKSKPTHLLSFAPHASTPTAFVLDKALSVKPEDRFASYDEFIHNLEYARNELRKRPTPAAKRVVLPNAAQSGSWVTIMVIAVVLAAGLGYYFGRGSGSGTGGLPTPPPGSVESKGDPDARYLKARGQIVSGKYRLAAVTFRELYADQQLKEPENSWAAVLNGLAELLDGRPAESRTAFGELGRKFTPGAIGLDDNLREFFPALSKVASKTELPTEADIANFDQKSCESVAFFVLGLKAWEAGAYDQGIALLRQFQQSVPSGEDAWVGEYRPLVASYLDDYGTFKTTVTDLTGYEANPEVADAALKRLPDVRAKLKSVGLHSELAKLERDLAPKIAAALASAKAQTDKKMTDLSNAENQVMLTAKYKMKGLCDTYRFKEALGAIQEIKVSLPDNVKDRDLLLRRVEWLVQFKEQLVRDLNAGGYSGPLTRRNGQPLPGGVAHASDLQLDIKLQFGNVPIAWADLTPQSVLAMARSFIKSTLPADVLSDRQWQAGVFCIFSGLNDESQALMEGAAAVKEEYRLHKALFFGQPEPQPDSGASAPPPPEPPKQDAPPSSGVEMAEKPLNPSKSDTGESIIKSLRPPRP